MAAQKQIGIKLCEYCGKPILRPRQANQRCHGKDENPECIVKLHGKIKAKREKLARRMLKKITAGDMAELLDLQEVQIEKFDEQSRAKQIKMVTLDLKRLELGIINVSDFMEWHPDYKGDLDEYTKIQIGESRKASKP